jgi:hypothetical protein
VQYVNHNHDARVPHSYKDVDGYPAAARLYQWRRATAQLDAPSQKVNVTDPQGSRLAPAQAADAEQQQHQRRVAARLFG